ncbi:lysophospholipid acyltransferase family protein [Albibacterium profundi]|uniref:Lysophospholipid acyltransferase family protein n=1 Tax=Albibacterium profundi TaxID=3134906 RepID=A0ABV5CEZ0_9SPHI
MEIQSRILSFFIYLCSLLPFWALYLLSDILYYVLYYIVGYRREVVFKNLKKSFPEKSSDDLKRIEKLFYRSLGDMIVENIKMASISAKESKKRLTILNERVLLDYLEKGQPVIMVTGHYSNWELGIHALSLLSPYPSLIVYKPLSNKVFGAAYNKIRSRFGAVMVPMKQTLRKIHHYRNRAHTSVFLADQTPMKSESKHFITFLNQPTLMYLGIEKIAKKLNYPIIYSHIDRVKRGYYTCEFTVLVDNPSEYSENEITDLHSSFLEQLIQKKPELWLWSHKRWKHKPHA